MGHLGGGGGSGGDLLGFGGLFLKVGSLTCGHLQSHSLVTNLTKLDLFNLE